MRHLYLFAAAIVIVGVAAYTLTLSFTQTNLLMSQIEALANGEDGESGGGGGTEEQPESGENGKYKYENPIQWCQEHRREQVSDGGNGHNWQLIRVGDGPKEVIVSICKSGTTPEYNLSSCTPYDPCNPAKPTI